MAKVRLNSESLIKIAMVVLFLIYAWSAGTGADASGNGSQYQLVKVSHGDTVWSIAARTVGDKEDIRTVVVAIKKANSLDNNMQIQPGQVLKVPAKK